MTNKIQTKVKIALAITFKLKSFPRKYRIPNMPNGAKDLHIMADNIICIVLITTRLSDSINVRPDPKPFLQVSNKKVKNTRRCDTMVQVRRDVSYIKKSQ